MTRGLLKGALFVCGGLLVGCSVGPVPFGDGHDRISSPSLLSAPAGMDVERLAKTDDCASCHADVASHWAHSAHANASFDNPWYRTSVDDFREQRGERASRFCAGCHDPLLLVSGDIDREVTPDNELAYAGITCLVCHSVESTRPDGNASLTLSDQPVLIPDPAVPAEIEAHRRRLSLEPLRTAAMCGACHRSFAGAGIGNENHLPGIDDLGDWSASAFAGAIPARVLEVEEATCQQCHMGAQPAPEGDLAATDGWVRGHRWAASHTTMASQLPDPAQYEQIVDALRAAARVDVGQTRSGKRVFVLPEEATVHGGERLVFDVVLENVGTGHRFPGGTRDMHDVWVEVDLSDASGRLLGVSRPTPDNNDGVFLLRSTVLDASANPEVLHQVHRFASPAFDRTVRPQDAQIVRYEIALPEGLSPPLRVDVRLMHRKHNLDFQRAACIASQSERGQEFARWARALGKVALDPCKPQPTNTIASKTVWMGGLIKPRPEPGETEKERSTVERLLSQAVGLLDGPQERVGEARPSLERARSLGREANSDLLVARAEVLLAHLASLEGRPDDAVEATQRATARVGHRPLFDRLRGDAYARVWRWKEAADAYRRVVEAAPKDPSAWRALARAYGSLADDEQALVAAETGLRFAPRDEGLLRSRALAMKALQDPDASLAEEAWLKHRTPDIAPELLASCERKHVRCRTDRQPIPLYVLRPPPRKAIHASAKSR